MNVETRKSNGETRKTAAELFISPEYHRTRAGHALPFPRALFFSLSPSLPLSLFLSSTRRRTFLDSRLFRSSREVAAGASNAGLTQSETKTTLPALTRFERWTRRRRSPTVKRSRHDRSQRDDPATYIYVSLIGYRRRCMYTTTYVSYPAGPARSNSHLFGLYPARYRPPRLYRYPLTFIPEERISRPSRCASFASFLDDPSPSPYRVSSRYPSLIAIRRI